MTSSSDPAEPPSAVRKGPLSRPGVRRALAAAATVLLIAGIVLFVRHQVYGRFQQDTDDATVSSDFVTVSPRISGTVQAVYVRDNQTVRKGDALVAIRAEGYAARLAQTEAQVQVSQALGVAASAGVEGQKAAVIQAQAQLAAAAADFEYAQREAARLAPLAATGAESDLRLREARNALAKAEAAVRVRRAEIDAQQSRVGELRAQLDQARAQGRAAQAEARVAKVDVDSAVLRASADGRIGEATVRVGQTVQPGSRLMSIVPIRDLYVEANLKETQMGLIRRGQPVSLHVDALPGAEIRGVVESIAPGTGAQFALIPPQNATGNFTKIVQRVPVRIALQAGPEARRILVPGMSVRASIDTRNARGAEERIRQEAKAAAR